MNLGIRNGSGDRFIPTHQTYETTLPHKSIEALVNRNQKTRLIMQLSWKQTYFYYEVTSEASQKQ